MGKSIEDIWKSGFMDNSSLVAPKVFDIYNRKSISTVDKLLEMGKSNLLYISAGGIVLLILGISNGATLAGILLFGLLMVSVKYGKDQSKKIEGLSKDISSYTYLKAVKAWLDDTIKGYTKLYRILYPGYILTFSIGLLKSDVFKEVLIQVNEKSPELITWLDIPIIWFLPIVVLAALSSIFTQRLYLADLNIVYGSIFRRLDVLIVDMEELVE